MKHKNTIFLTIAFTLSLGALCALLATPAYTAAARSEACGYAALSQKVADSDVRELMAELTGGAQADGVRATSLQ